MKKTLQLVLFCFIVSTMAVAQKTKTVEITELNDITFKQKVWNFDSSKTFKRAGKLPIILDFYATWCRPCKMLAPHLEAIQNKYKGKLIVYKIDVDKQPELARRFNVSAMPTIVFINEKNKYKSELGYRNYDEFETMVKTYFLLK